MTSLTTLDKRIVNKLQEGIPFVSKPWARISKNLGLKEDMLLKRIHYLKKKGIIRRIAATFNLKKIGFVSTLVAAKVAPSKINKAAQKINSYDEVTHNYKRNSEYNLWFTLIAKSKRRISQIIKEIEKNKDISAILNLPATKVFKIEVRFNND